jgi:hypothetical protein
MPADHLDTHTHTHTLIHILFLARLPQTHKHFPTFISFLPHPQISIARLRVYHNNQHQAKCASRSVEVIRLTRLNSNDEA